MAYPEFLKTGWEDNVRALLGGVSTTDVSNTFLALDAYGPASEEAIKALISDWATLKITFPNELNRVAYAHVASKVCPYLKVKLLQSEKVGADYSYTMQKIDWDKLALDLLALFYQNLALVDSEAVGELNVIEISQRTPPYFTPLSIEEMVEE